MQRVMITRLRQATKKIVRTPAKLMVKAGLSANYITLLGLALSFLYPLFTFLHHIILASFFLAFSSFMDAIDGEVARMRNSQGPKGSFLDSVTDRIEDVVFVSGLYFLGIPALPLILLAGLSVTISYIRAKSESLGVKMEGRGIIERGERLISIFLITLLGHFSPIASLVLFYALLVLSVVTVIQRGLIGYRNIVT